MTTVDRNADNGTGARVGAPEVRAALERVLGSPAFLSSRKLKAFLTFVVEATLAGNGERIKSYTIGVEALGRTASFDPQSDPIVRVEAGRLRRALARYYADHGRNDAVVIELPRGHYVPTFRRRRVHPGLANLRLSACRAITRRLASRWPVAACAAIIAAGLIAPAVLWSSRTSGADKIESTHIRTVASYEPFPVVHVAPFDVVNRSLAPAGAVEHLHARLRDMIARFDEIAVASGPVAGGPSSARQGRPHPGRVDYELSGLLEFHGSGAVSPSFRLIDAADGAVVWARAYDPIRIDAGSRVAESAVMQQLVRTLVQPHGVIQRHQQARRAAGAAVDPRYACVLDAFEAWPSYDAAKEAAVRACLLRETANDPTFSAGFAALATLYFREHVFGFGAEHDDASALDRALAAAQRAVVLDPESARARQALMEAHFHRGEIDKALEHGNMAVALNPYDSYVLGGLGVRLVFMGEIERGLSLLGNYLRARVVAPGRLGFALFLASHLAGNREAAAFFAGQITNRRYPLGILARTLAARAAGDPVQAHREFARLVALNAGWHDDPHGELKKFFPVAAVADRLAADLLDALTPVSQ